MSYCRWSSLNGYCDVYVYEDVHGGWTTHVAARRRPAGAVADESGLLMASGGDAEHPAMKLYMEQHRLAMEWSKNSEPIALDHEEAGVSFNHDTPGECADNLERLRREGFIVPQWAIDELRAEQDGEGGVKAEHVGPLGGMIVICVEPGTEVRSEDGTLAVVDDSHTVISGKGALYVTPKIYELLKASSAPA